MGIQSYRLVWNPRQRSDGDSVRHSGSRIPDIIRLGRRQNRLGVLMPMSRLKIKLPDWRTHGEWVSAVGFIPPLKGWAFASLPL